MVEKFKLYIDSAIHKAPPHFTSAAVGLTFGHGASRPLFRHFTSQSSLEYARLVAGVVLLLILFIQ